MNKPTTGNTANYQFFLGGHDLEMIAIRELIENHSSAIVHDKRLRWGARASDYRQEINAALAAGATPVLVELEQDLDLPEDKARIVDHHGDSAGHDKPTCLEQVFALLELPRHLWTRHRALVAANDRGYIPAMRQELNATPEEIRTIRQQDRQAQGITADEERAAIAAIDEIEYCCHGRLAIARLPHNRTAALVDRLQPEAGGPGIDNILVISPGEVNFYGTGAAVAALAKKYPSGWYGGDLPVKGFWGMAGEELPAKSLVLFLKNSL